MAQTHFVRVLLGGMGICLRSLLEQAGKLNVSPLADKIRPSCWVTLTQAHHIEVKEYSTLL